MSSASHDAWEGAVHGEGCVGLTVRTSVQAAHRELRLLQLREPFSFPLDLIWRKTSGPLRRVLAAAITTALNVRDEQHWHPDGEPAGGAAGTSHGTRPRASGVS